MLVCYSRALKMLFISMSLLLYKYALQLFRCNDLVFNVVVPS